MRTGISLGLVLLLGACAIRDPRWDGLDPKAREALRTIRKEKPHVYDPEAFRRLWLALSEEDRAHIRREDLVGTDGYLYRPSKVERSRGRPFDDLKLAWIVDTGTNDPGEIDLYADDEVSVSLGFYGVDYVPRFLNFVPDEAALEWREQHWTRTFLPRAIGFNAGVGGGTTSAGTGDQVLFAVVNLGLFVEWFDFLGLEVGTLFGISPDSALDSTQNDDSAYYYGVRLDTGRLGAWTRATWKRWTD